MSVDGRRSFLASACFLFFLHVVHVETSSNVSYLCLYPEEFRPESQYTVSVTLFNAVGPVSLKVSLVGSNDFVLSSESSVVYFQKGESIVSKTVTLDIPPVTSERSYNVIISGTGGLSFTDTGSVTVLLTKISLFIQTDKAIYKPGQTVLFRVVAIYPDMKPYKGEMDITIFDKEHNKISQWLNQKDNTGVVSGELVLSDLTPLGTWTIEAVCEPDSVSKTFEVCEYVLPKHEVEVVLPSFYLLNLKRPKLQKPLRITVNAKYTYGKPVKGTVRLTAQTVRDPWEIPLGIIAVHPSWTKTVDLVSGQALAEISPVEMATLIPDNLVGKPSPFGKLFDLSGRRIIVVAEVTETVTGVTLSSNNTVDCYSEKYDLTFLETSPDAFKTGMVYTGYLQLTQKDGLPPARSDVLMANDQFRSITLHVYPSPWLSLECSFKKLQKDIPLTLSGIMSFSFIIDLNCDHVTLEAWFHDVSTDTDVTNSKVIGLFYSLSLAYLQVSIVTSNPVVRVNDRVKFSILTTKQTSTLNYIIVSKGKIIISKTVEKVRTNPYIFELYVDSTLAQTLAPMAKCVVWFVTATDEIISDSVEFSVQGAFSNKVSVSFDSKQLEPGDKVTLSVHGSPGSTAYVSAVDKSVKLLKGGNDITQDMVINDLKKLESLPDWHGFQENMDSVQVFFNAHLKCLTNGQLSYIVQPDMQGVPAMLPLIMDPGFLTPLVHTSIRKSFPETWIWSNFSIGDDGTGSLHVTLPDTITSWVASCFATHDIAGLGIAPSPDEVIAFKPFFIFMTLPYSIRRSEEFTLQVSVFNYLKSAQKVHVTLKASKSFQVRRQTRFAETANITRTINVPKNDVKSVSFWIVPSHLGLISIEVSATCDMAFDAELRTLLVVPEGVEQQYSTSVLINSPPAYGREIPNFMTQFNVTFPPSSLVVQGTIHIQVTVIGDILGSTLCDLDKLVQMPTGCGEQTMLSLAPDISILEYLRSTNSLTKDIETKIKRFMVSGYQRELTFQRNDGSFSAFGNNDEAGSIWLSAFVCLTFHEAKGDIPVDDEKVARTLLWIIQLQNRHGSFSESPLGKVIHTDMQGGSSHGVALTAYVLIALMENLDNSVVNKTQLNSSIHQALVYLEQQLDLISNDTYALCIVSYALVVANSSKAEVALAKRDALAKEAGGLKHWEKPKTSSTNSDFNELHKQCDATDIEMTAYCLLTYAFKTDFSGGIPIAKWLLSRRNANGGFCSTQDTVMALKALSKFGPLLIGPQVSLQVFAKTDLEQHAFDPITETNKLILQIWELNSTNVNEVFINTKGVGVAMVQMNVRYNVIKVKQNSGLTLDVKTLSNRTYKDRIVVRTCARWVKTDRIPGMIVETIQLLSGYTFDSIAEDENVSAAVRKVETIDQSVNIYYDSLDNTPTCVNVTFRRDVVVGNNKPALIKMFEYYCPENYVKEMYSPDPLGTWSSLCSECLGEDRSVSFAAVLSSASATAIATVVVIAAVATSNRADELSFICHEVLGVGAFVG